MTTIQMGGDGRLYLSRERGKGNKRITKGRNWWLLKPETRLGTLSCKSSKCNMAGKRVRFVIEVIE